MDFGMMMMMMMITFEKASFVCIWVLISTFVLLLKIAPAISCSVGCRQFFFAKFVNASKRKRNGGEGVGEVSPFCFACGHRIYHEISPRV
jgi:hypothetical protein